MSTAFKKMLDNPNPVVRKSPYSNERELNGSSSNGSNSTHPYAPLIAKTSAQEVPLLLEMHRKDNGYSYIGTNRKDDELYSGEGSGSSSDEFYVGGCNTGSDSCYSSDNIVTKEEVFEFIRGLLDPEHPYTLEQLNVVKISDIHINNFFINLFFTPTIPHCSQATLIGLMIRVKLMRCLSEIYKVDVQIAPGTHNTEAAVNKQLRDKERVAAALENPALHSVITQGIANSDKWESLIKCL